MKRGPQGEIPFTPAKKKQKTEEIKIPQFYKELLEEVFLGEFTDFQEYLSQKGVTELSVPKNLSDNEFKLLIQALKNTKVTSLSFKNYGLGDDGVRRLGQILKNTNVTSVNLWGNQIGPAGAKDFGQALKETQVTSVDLSGNQIGDAGAKDFGQALKDTRVTSVNLSYNQIGPVGAKDFGQTLKDTRVTSVNLSHNRIRSFGAKYFGRALKDTQVTSVNLCGNEIDVHGIRSFAQALKDTQVTSIDLSGNQIGDNGAAYIAQALKDTKLKAVRLFNCRIGDAGAIYIAEALKDTQVTSVDLCDNPINTAGIKGIGQAIKDTQVMEIRTSYNIEDAVAAQQMGPLLTTIANFASPTIGDYCMRALTSVIPDSALTDLFPRYHYYNFLTTLEQNREKTILTPYYVSCLRYSSAELTKFLTITPNRQPSLTTSKNADKKNENKKNDLEYAFGIIANLGPALIEVVNSFLPGMSYQLRNGKNRAAQYTTIARQMRGEKQRFLQIGA